MSDDKGNDLDRMLDDLGIGNDDAAPPADADADLAELGEALAVADVPHDAPAHERARTFLAGLLEHLDPAYDVAVHETPEGHVAAEIEGGDAGRLIGKGGRTLAALEQLANAVVNKPGDEPVRVHVDVGGYKRRRDERLTRDAQAAADQVRKYGEPVEMEPMSAAERRVVHMAVVDDADVASESTGSGRDRRVVLRPNYDGGVAAELQAAAAGGAGDAAAEGDAPADAFWGDLAVGATDAPADGPSDDEDDANDDPDRSD